MKRPVRKRHLTNVNTRLFEVEPNSIEVLHFDPDEDVKSNPAFPMLARIMVDMVDLAVGFLGPDLDPLTEDLMALGGRHIKYGVKPEWLPAMNVALIYALRKSLPGFSARDAEAWRTVFAFMVEKMQAGLREAQRQSQAKSSFRAQMMKALA